MGVLFISEFQRAFGKAIFEEDFTPVDIEVGAGDLNESLEPGAA